MTLSEYLLSKNSFDGVAMIRLVYNGHSHDYTKWKVSGQNLFFFDTNMKVCHILWTTDTISVVDENHITIAIKNNETIGLELFYGGAILN
jgi:hypothetical protein